LIDRSWDCCAVVFLRQWTSSSPSQALSFFAARRGAAVADLRPLQGISGRPPSLGIPAATCCPSELHRLPPPGPTARPRLFFFTIRSCRASSSRVAIADFGSVRAAAGSIWNRVDPARLDSFQSAQPGSLQLARLGFQLHCLAKLLSSLFVQHSCAGSARRISVKKRKKRATASVPSCLFLCLLTQDSREKNCLSHFPSMLSPSLTAAALTLSLLPRDLRLLQTLFQCYDARYFLITPTIVTEFLTYIYTCVDFYPCPHTNPKP
jgi:hypothetical protein